MSSRLLASRRSLLQSGLALATTAALDGCSPSSSSPPSSSAQSPEATASQNAYAMPAESLPHERTFMAWPALEEVWGDQLPAVRQDIVNLARAIAEYEPVVLMARSDQSDQAQQQCGTSVEVIALPVDDLWARDTGPTFVTGPGALGLAGVDFNFNGWGNKQTHANDSHLVENLLAKYRIARTQAPIVTEGGALEVDGEGTLMATESSLVNPNRNPGKTRDQIEAALKELLGVRTVIWFAGVAGQDITDCHVDALVRFVEPGTVVLHRPDPDAPSDVWSQASAQALQVLADATDAKGRKLHIIDLTEPDLTNIPGAGKDFLATYLNYYVINGAVIIPKFGDQAADADAAGTLGDLYPGRDIVQVSINNIAAGGGGIHCSTQQQPKVTATSNPTAS